MTTPKINTEIIKEVFNTMKYSEEKEETPILGSNFLKDLSPEVVNSLLVQFVKNDKWGSLKNAERETLMNNLASEIEKNETSLVLTLEEKARGISSSFTKQKSLPYLISTLRYYSNFCELVEGKQKDILICKLSDFSCLSLFSCTLCPALAAGCRVLFVSPPGLANTVKIIELIMEKKGFPQGTISVVTDDSDLDIVFKHGSIVSIFDTTCRKVTNKKMLAVIPMPTPIVVFDNADLDSACESIINATWKNQLMFHSTAKEVFVQETIYKEFVKKLKDKMLSSNFDNNWNKFEDSLRTLVSTSEKNGIEIFPTRSGDAPYGKTLFIGGRVNNKNTENAPYISVAAFRNIDEAIALANNTSQGLSVSIWTENIGLANQLAQKVDVSNVWINSFGIYSPDVTFSPKKMSGKGYFGGIQGFNEFLHKKDCLKFQGDKIIVQGGERIFANAITSAKSGYQSWSSLSRYMRMNKFSKVIQYIENNTNSLRTKIITDDWLHQWKSLFYEYIASHYDFSIFSSIKGYQLNVSYIPRGVLVAETTNNIENHNKKLLISSILEGNSLILLNQSEPLQSFYGEISKLLPIGVLNVVPYFNGTSQIALKSPIVEGYFNEYIIDEEMDTSNKFSTISSSWSDIHSKVTYVKNVWSNVGQGSPK